MYDSVIDFISGFIVPDSISLFPEEKPEPRIKSRYCIPCDFDPIDVGTMKDIADLRGPRGERGPTGQIDYLHPPTVILTGCLPPLTLTSDTERLFGYSNLKITSKKQAVDVVESLNSLCVYHLIAFFELPMSPTLNQELRTIIISCEAGLVNGARCHNLRSRLVKNLFAFGSIPDFNSGKPEVLKPTNFLLNMSPPGDFSCLPRDIFKHIISYLHPIDKTKLFSTCISLYHCMSDFPDEFYLIKTMSVDNRGYEIREVGVFSEVYARTLLGPHYDTKRPMHERLRLTNYEKSEIISSGKLCKVSMRQKITELLEIRKSLQPSA